MMSGYRASPETPDDYETAFVRGLDRHGILEIVVSD